MAIARLTPRVSIDEVRYTFPDSAFEVQKLTAALFIENTRAYCLNGLGSGKTRSILFAYDALKKAGVVQRMLVICPLSATQRTWEREITLNFPWLKSAIVHGKHIRTARILSKVDIYIINHDGMKVMYESLIDREDIDTITVDEVAVFRNGNSQRTKTLKSLVHDRQFVWALTGSPIPRSVTDVWGPCSCLTPHTVPRFFGIFREQLMKKVSLFRWEPKPGAEEHAVACMQPSVRFPLSAVTELPPQVQQYYEATLTSQQFMVYEAMRKQAIVLIGERKIDALNAGAVLSKLLQIALGYVYSRDGHTVTLDNSPRLQLILDLIDATPQKVLLFVPFKSALSAFSAMMTANNIEHAVVSGDTPIKQRNVIFTQFQDTKKYKAIAAHPACMAHSLTLTEASTTIWAGPTTSLEIFQQANGRTNRIGQRFKTLVAMIGGTPIEERMYKLLGANETLQNKFLQIIQGLTTGEI
jgi:SNF2 family DNA or RNA helicase